MKTPKQAANPSPVYYGLMALAETDKAFLASCKEAEDWQDLAQHVLAERRIAFLRSLPTATLASIAKGEINVQSVAKTAHKDTSIY